MQDGIGVLATSRRLTGLLLEDGLVARSREHLEPGVVRLRDEVARFVPKDAVTGSRLCVVQDVPARSFERCPALVESGNHRRWTSF